MLLQAYDKKIFRMIAKAAREAHPITASPGPEPGGSVIKLGAGNEFNAQALVDAFFEAAAILDEKNVPLTDASLSCHQDSTTLSSLRLTPTFSARLWYNQGTDTGEGL